MLRAKSASGSGMTAAQHAKYHAMREELSVAAVRVREAADRRATAERSVRRIRVEVAEVVAAEAGTRRLPPGSPLAQRSAHVAVGATEQVRVGESHGESQLNAREEELL